MTTTPSPDAPRQDLPAGVSGFPVEASPGHDAPIVYRYNNEIHVRASALGYCPKALWHAFHGFPAEPPPAAMQEIFNKGHDIESHVTTLLKEQGWVIDEAQPEYDHDTGLKWGNESDAAYPIIIVGHGDLVAYPPPSIGHSTVPLVVEIKGLGPDYMRQYQNKGFMSILGYGYQLSFYAQCEGAPTAYTAIWDKENEDLSIKSYPFADLFTLDDLRDIIIHVLAETPSPTCTNQYPCPYYKFHDITKTVTVIPAELIPTSQGLIKVKEQIKQLQQAEKAMTASLKSSLEPGNWKGPGFRINIISNPPSLDRSKIESLLKEAELDIADYMKPSTGYRLTITAKDKDD